MEWQNNRTEDVNHIKRLVWLGNYEKCSLLKVVDVYGLDARLKPVMQEFYEPYNKSAENEISSCNNVDKLHASTNIINIEFNIKSSILLFWGTNEIPV